MMEQSRNIIVDYIEALVIAIILALFIRAFIVQAYTIPSGSMKDTLLIGDFLLVNKFAYGVKIPFTNKTIINLGEPQHNDIIVFANPENPDKEDYIKRVVGLPGDVLEMQDGVLYRNGEKVNEPYLRERVPLGSTRDKSSFASLKVPADSFFMMGDNRDESWDSRGWGFVPREKLIGKAWRIYWSWNKDDSSVRWGRIGSSMQTLSKL